MSDLIVIDDNTNPADIDPTGKFQTGLIARDFSTHPQGFMAEAKPFDLPLIPVVEMKERLAEQTAKNSSLEPLVKPRPILDQDGYGYCWGHSSTNVTMTVRAYNNQPYIPLSAFAVCSIIKNYRNQGGFCAQSLEFIAKVGVPSQALWPQGECRRALDTPEMRTDAAKNVVTEWMDLDDDPDVAAHQLATCLLLNIPVATDFNWWGHSVETFRLLSWEPFETLIKNSWKGWGDNGVGKLSGRRAKPNGAIAPRVVRANVP